MTFHLVFGTIGEEQDGSVRPTLWKGAIRALDNGFEADLITLIDDEGQEHEFEIIDELDNDDGHFMALVPTQPDQEDASAEAETYYIFEVVDEDGEEQLQEVEDDALLDELADIFESRFNEAFYDGAE